MINFAICVNAEGGQNNKLFSQSWADSHPGAGWLQFFKQKGIDDHSFNCVSGDVAIEMIESGEWKVDNTFIIDELGSKLAKKLSRLGCHRFLQTAFEAPLYAPLFYDYDQPEKYRYASRYISKSKNNGQVIIQKFPSFYRSSIKQNTKKRFNRIVCVAANKYRAGGFDFSMVTDKNSLVKWIKHSVGRIISPTYSASLHASLHDVRLEVLSKLSRDDFLDLYGLGWDNHRLVPVSQFLNLQNITRAWRGVAGCKHELIQRYEFGLCIENMEQPGYVTEKIFNCLAAGVIPVYLGASDITDFVPSNVFINLRTLLDNHISVSNFLNELSQEKREAMRLSALNFLNSPQGDGYSYEGYAEWVYGLTTSI